MGGQIPHLDAEINFIVSYIWNGCRTPFMLMIDCAQEPAGEAAMALLDFGFDDILRSFFRPKGLRSGRHGRKRRGKKRFSGVPEISDMMASRIDGLEEFRGRSMQQGTKMLWIIDNWAQRAIWEVAIIDITATFLYKSMLGILKLKATHCAIPGRICCEGQEWDAFNNGQWYAIPIQNERYADGGYFSSTFAAHIPAGARAQVMASVKFTNIDNHQGSVKVRFGILGGPDSAIYEDDLGTLGAGETRDAIFSAIVEGPCTLQWTQQSFGAEIGVAYSNITAFNSFF